MKALFLYLGQCHQVFHSLPIAAEMVMRHPDVEVHAAAASATHVQFLQRLWRKHVPHARIRIEQLLPVAFDCFPHKKRLLRKNLAYLRSFDAIVTPERTSLFLRKIGIGRTRLIWTRHGAGDRAVGFADDIHEFDYVLLSGRKIEERLLAAKQIRAGQYTSGIYAKFDWLRTRRSDQRVFDNGRPVVIYNPHFRKNLSSWPQMGVGVLNFFAVHPEWNLIFAPHVRLFERFARAKFLKFQRFACLPNVHVDLGSERSIDMTYTNEADLYLGDVSSQVAEFVCRPRPCLFLNAHRVDWHNDPNYKSWRLGPVIEDLDELAPALERAFSSHGDFIVGQRRYVAETFELPHGTSSAARGADAIVMYLESCRGNVRGSTQRAAEKKFVPA
ncbi:MAG TPA: hypothetical protein VJU59_43760 [Paraburkholderia sp.]|uniref:hypothetical protein n=1 Tax=Paraburkholderia sp. TaxID=1926495 RepID=UPI002B47AAC5|nr:hypothetical protein [Paraburkholderia sp.]HKR46510.1 hypothetical protein [Paraburkholderia sp.]